MRGVLEKAGSIDGALARGRELTKRILRSIALTGAALIAIGALRAKTPDRHS